MSESIFGWWVIAIGDKDECVGAKSKGRESSPKSSSLLLQNNTV